MKNPSRSVLPIITVFVAAFTIGIFIGRNYGGQPMTLSIPEEIQLPPPSISSVPDEQSNDVSSVFFPIDINGASLNELTELPGIGQALAGEIIAYREAHGRFSHVEELINVPGIGENRLEAILSLITVGGTQ